MNCSNKPAATRVGAGNCARDSLFVNCYGTVLRPKAPTRVGPDDRPEKKRKEQKNAIPKNINKSIANIVKIMPKESKMEPPSFDAITHQASMPRVASNTERKTMKISIF